MPGITVPCHTARLTLRPFEHGDLMAFTAYAMSCEAARALGWKLRDAADCRGALAQMVAETALNRPGDRLTLAIQRRLDRVVVGEVALTWSDATAGQGELTCIVARDHAGRGYGLEASVRMLDIGFSHFRLHRIFGRCGAGNRPAVRLMERLGMRCEAHLVEHRIVDGDWDEEYLYAMLDREWAAGRGLVAVRQPAERSAVSAA